MGVGGRFGGSVRELTEYRQTEDGRTELPLKFGPYQAYFVVVGKAQGDKGTETQSGEDRVGTDRRAVRALTESSGSGSPALPKNFPELKSVYEITGPWEVAFDAKWMCPKIGTTGSVVLGRSLPDEKQIVTFDKLEDWTKRSEEGIRNYSGIAVYRKVFDLPSEIRNLKSGMHIDLGVLHVMARVRLNGRDLGVIWCPPWRVKIPVGLLKEQGNELEVTVANTWGNRLYADAGLPEEKRLTRVEGRMYERAKSTGLKPAGLVGPVQLKSHIPRTGEMSE